MSTRGFLNPSLRRPDHVRPEGVPLYVHFPFCVVKCTYCDFYSVAEFEGRSTSSQPLGFVLDDLVREAERRAPRNPVTVFLGGGTPSIHGADELARFLDRLDDCCGFRRSAVEVTMECNPESLDEETAAAAVEGGVNRLSIGVQSLDPATLELFGRAHGPAQAEQAVRAAKAAGCRRVNVDLIYSAPTQQLESWRAELAQVLGWGPDHVSAYSLAYEKGTLLTLWKSQGRVEDHPEEVARGFFLGARAALENQGFSPYEVSNFTRGELCLHNLNAWWNGPYVGLGPSAVSSLDGVRFGQKRSVRAWRESLATDAPTLPMDWEERLEPERRVAESWWLGLRLTHGLDATRAGGLAWSPTRFLRHAAEEAALHRGERPATTDEPLPQAGPWLACAEELESEGWLVRSGTRWRVADHAWPLVDAIARRFLDPR